VAVLSPWSKDHNSGRIFIRVRSAAPQESSTGSLPGSTSVMASLYFFGLPGTGTGCWIMVSDQVRNVLKLYYC
jgi:hypothetical protein